MAILVCGCGSSILSAVLSNRLVLYGTNQRGPRAFVSGCLQAVEMMGNAKCKRVDDCVGSTFTRLRVLCYCYCYLVCCYHHPYTLVSSGWDSEESAIEVLDDGSRLSADQSWGKLSLWYALPCWYLIMYEIDIRASWPSNHLCFSSSDNISVCIVFPLFSFLYICSYCVLCSFSRQHILCPRACHSPIV